MKIKEEVKNIIEEISEKKLEDDFEKLNLVDDLFLSSLDVLCIIVNIEKEFNISLEEKDIYEMKSIRELIELINTLNSK